MWNKNAETRRLNYSGLSGRLDRDGKVTTPKINQTIRLPMSHRLMKQALGFILVATLFSCTQKESPTIKTIKIFNSKGKYIGDSVLNDGLLQKIVFKDSSLIIDSIVFYRYDNDARSVESKFTFIGGDRVFENVEYHQNGQVSRYLFFDEEKHNYFYERIYDTLGNLIEAKGEVFFQGYLSGLNFKTLDAQQGTNLKIKIFHPNPPDCRTKLSVKLEDDSNAEVFSRNKNISFLKEVSGSVEKPPIGKIWTEIDVWLELQGANDTFYYNQAIYYKVVD